MSAPQPAAWAQQPLTREEAAHGREWLRQDPWAFWACLAGHIRVTWSHDWEQALVYQLRGYRAERQDVPEDHVLIPWAQNMPWDWMANTARYWPLAQRTAGGGGVLDRSRAVKASELPSWRDDPQLVQGRMHANQLTLLHGAPAAAKGFLALDLAFRCALGLDWFGARILRKTRTLIIYTEGGQRLGKRVGAWCQVHGYSPAALGDVVIYPHRVAQLTEQTAAEITAWCQDEDFGQVIYDNIFTTTAGQDLRGPEDSGMAMSLLGMVRDDTGGHVVAVHHDNRGASFYGGVAFDVYSDTRIHCTGSDSDPVRKASARGPDGKQRDLAPFTFSYALETVYLGTDAAGQPVTSCAVREPTPGEVAADAMTREARLERVAGAMGDNPRMSGKALAGKLAPELGVSVRTVEGWISDMRKRPGR